MKDSNDEKEKRIYMHLNDETNKCIATMQSDINYDFIEKASKNFLEEFSINDESYRKNVIKMPIERTIQVMLHFFKSIDESFYKQAKAIVDKECDIELRIYNPIDVKDFNKRDEDGFAIYADWPCIETNGKKSIIHIHQSESLKDLYAIVHEIGHTFCNNKNNNYRAMFVENQSLFLEKLLSRFLIKKIDNEQLTSEVIDIEKEKFEHICKNAFEIFIKARFTRIKKEKGVISKQEVFDFQNEFGGTDIQILNRICDFDNNINYNSRYVIGELISNRMLSIYEQNSDDMIKSLKEYFEHINSGNLEKSLGIFNINLDENCIYSLIAETKKNMQTIIEQNNNIIDQHDSLSRDENNNMLKQDELR